MKQAISPKVFVVIIAVAVVLFAGAAYWVWKAPTATAKPTAAFHPHPGGVREQFEAMRAAHMAGRTPGQGTAPQSGAP
jgi:hypothetical protein